ncbi:hypothetical protein DYU05_11495 [Mucilaginibacter terrenus]|uniref:histidine kinase n=1 Tax=Mucilaginibacter terrenus TaxID=2482727 RepID=A0A3E2NP74_9SPHI|nr:tetratricopeptide repeat protein [Mucilaginibacter terrenus]RFZ82782.1 hypothetical protein DYU05_11495 [Mucilaginibacter terrenus]
MLFKYIRNIILLAVANCLLVLSVFASPRSRGVDSIKTLLNAPAGDSLFGDTVKVNRLIRLASNYFQSNPDSAFYFAQKGVELARKINYPEGIANGLLQTGHVNYFKGRSDPAKRDLEEAIAIFKQLKNDKGLSAAYVSLGRMYNLLANYHDALKYLNLALVINKRIDDEPALTNNYKNIGVIYYSQGELSKALDFYYKGLYIAVKNQYRIPSAELYNNIGVVLQSMEVYPTALEYFEKALRLFKGTKSYQAVGTVNENIGEVLLAQKQYKKAVNNLTQSLAVAKRQGDIDGLCSLYTDLGLCFAYTNNSAKGLLYLDTAVQLSQKYKYVYNQAYALIGLSTVYNMQHNYSKAYDNAMQGYKLAGQLKNISVRAKASQQLSETLAGLNRFNEAYRYLNEYLSIKTKLKDNESIQKLTSYNYALDFSTKERQLKEEERDRNLLFQQEIARQRSLIIISFVVIVAMVIILFSYYRQKKAQQKINALLEVKNSEVILQKASLDEQTHKLNDLNSLKDRLISILAHDLRAPLSTLRGVFDLLQDESITHQEMLDMIPGVIKNLDYTSDFLDTLLFWINSQLSSFANSVSTFRVKDVLKYEIDSYVNSAAKKGVSLTDQVPAGLSALADPNSIRIVIRNLVTNAIKFTAKGDTIGVCAIREANKVVISIKDSGSGMDATQLSKLFKERVDSQVGTNKELGTGLGLLFCKDLIERCNGKIWVISEQGVGTTFSFSLPLGRD